MQSRCLDGEIGDGLMVSADAQLRRGLVDFDGDVAAPHRQGVASIFKFDCYWFVFDLRQYRQRGGAVRVTERGAADPFNLTHSVIKPQSELAVLPVARHHSGLRSGEGDEKNRESHSYWRRTIDSCFSPVTRAALSSMYTFTSLRTPNSGR